MQKCEQVCTISSEQSKPFTSVASTLSFLLFLLPFSFISPCCSKPGPLKMNYFLLYPHELACIHHRITPAITSHIHLSLSLNKGLHNSLTVTNPTSCLLRHQPGSGRVVAWHTMAATQRVRPEAYRGGGGMFKPPARNSGALQNRAKLNPIVKTVKNGWI